ncbi:permease, partial [Xylella fastidiosa subsp. multiplex]|nr:permease [Xylella fastidiosa subsp. multiplex]
GLGEPFPDPSTFTGDATATKSEHQRDKEMVEAKAKEVHAAQKAKIKQTPVRKVLIFISSIFLPLIPVFVVAVLISRISSNLS